MPEQETNIEQEIKNDSEEFAEKLKNAQKAEDKGSHGENELEELIKRNQEMVHRSEAVMEQAKEQIAKTPSPVKTVQKDDDGDSKGSDADKRREHVKFHAKDVSSLQNPEDQIAKIVDLASKKDPYFAIKVAKHIDNNYILDRVHDQLVETKVREALIGKGLLEEIK